MGKGTEPGWGEQRMVMDGDQVHFLPLWEVSRCCIGTGRTTAQSAGSGGGKRGTLSPVCPGGPHVYDGRTPAVSPKPSSQTPGSYCFSPFGCPARGRNTDRYLHWGHSNHSISFPHCVPDMHRGLSQTTEGLNQCCTNLGMFFFLLLLFLRGNHIVCAQIWFSGVKTTCWQNVDSYKCLPPCFLLSSPFWSPFFGCSLGLWGCC